jgi:hypothetical protein
MARPCHILARPGRRLFSAFEPFILIGARENPLSRIETSCNEQILAEASGSRTGEEIDNKGNPLESIRLSDQNLNIRRGLAQF